MIQLPEQYKNYQKFIDIETAKQLHEEMKNNVEKYQKLSELTFNDYVQTVKANINYWEYLTCIKGAIEWLSKLDNGEKIDRRRRYEEKDCFDFFQDNLCKLLDRKIKIKEIRTCGYEGYCYSILFDYEGQEYCIEIPDTKQISPKNITYAHFGKITLYRCENSIYTEIEGTYTPEKLKDAFDEHIKNFKKDEV